MARVANNHIERQAQDWFIRLESGTLSPKDQARFADWLDANPAHRAAYRQLDAFSQSLVGVEQLATLSALPAKASQGATTDSTRGLAGWLERLADLLAARRAVFAWTSVVLFVASASLISLFYTLAVQGPAMSYSTRTAELRTIKLGDGTVVSLGARTRLAVHYGDRQRNVLFADGEAYFDVAPNPDKPFIVQAGDTQVQVLGTQFNLRTRSGGVGVAVAQGKVSVIQPKASIIPWWGQIRPQRLTLTAGEQVVASAGAFQPVAPVSVKEVGSWRHGKLIYHNAKLGEVLADVRRYTNKDIILVDPSLAELRLSVVLGVDQVDKMMVALATLLPVAVDQSVPGIIAVKPRPIKKNL